MTHPEKMPVPGQSAAYEIRVTDDGGVAVRFEHWNAGALSWQTVTFTADRAVDFAQEFVDAARRAAGYPPEPEDEAGAQ